MLLQFHCVKYEGKNEQEIHLLDIGPFDLYFCLWPLPHGDGRNPLFQGFDPSQDWYY